MTDALNFDCLNNVSNITICNACLNGVGGICHTPGCIFIRNTAPDIAIREMVIDCGGKIEEVKG